ncbi:phosphate ABC transporter ATP-binding protein [Rhodohalobacter sp. 614A]|uniref:phosphate ABC transporter ATP-binding protein n=1 Tax=Rhodohalobacter sp. 614A TaxID=2908649 RepID=UPI001F2AFB85|nr:phosphate ABC transporter ATP-binding protein [Rhodohalobacter sp. 614A]
MVLTETPIIRIRDLNVHAPDHHILKNIHLDIPKNKITVLLGPSGCGKTTLLKSLNRLTDLYSELKVKGNIFIDGDDILHPDRDVTQIRQKMGLLSQRPYPLPMSIFKNVAYGLKLKGIKNKEEIQNRVQEYLEKAALWDEVKDRLHSSAEQLSIGQQQRLCLARGLAVNPEVILADEPTSALDPVSTQMIEQQFQQLKEEYTIVLVTHMLRQARRLADYVVFIYYGEIIEHGPVEQVLDHPKEELTKKYVTAGV